MEQICLYLHAYIHKSWHGNTGEAILKVKVTMSY